MKTDIVPFVNDIRKSVIGFDRLWDDLVHREPFKFDDSFPKDNVMSVDNTVIIELALAGYKKEDITIERDGSSLKVSASKRDEEEIEEVKYIRKQIAQRAFTKSYTIAPEYKDVRARFQDGILSIHLEREPSEETKKLVEIS
jgi:molecular chaperone IbpA